MDGEVRLGASGSATGVGLAVGLRGWWLQAGPALVRGSTVAHAFPATHWA